MTITASNTKKGPPIGKAMTSAPVRSNSANTAAQPPTINASDFRSVRIDSAMVYAGAVIGMEMFNGRDFSKLKTYVASANNRQDAHLQTCGLSMLYGIGCALAEGLAAAVRAGAIRLSGDKLPTAADLQYAMKTDAAAFSAYLSAIVQTAQRAGAVSGFQMHTTQRGQRRAAEKTEDTPTKVEVVGMPVRETTSSIVRNKDGQIVATMQRETDAR